jgi:hypothetical protein
LTVAFEDQVKEIRAAYAEYTKSKRDFLAIAEQCSFKGWPDRKQALKKCWRLQHLLNELDALRFEYLMDANLLEVTAHRTLQSIFERLERNWSADEEEALKGASQVYRELLREVAELQAGHDPEVTDEPLRAVQSDSEYIRARRVIYEKVHEIDKRLGHP